MDANNYKSIDITKNRYANNKRTEQLFKGIELENNIENKRITPRWFIEQNLALNIYDDMQQMIEAIDDIYNHTMFNTGEELMAKKFYLESMIVFSRMTELKSKFERTSVQLSSWINLLKEKHFEDSTTWPNNKFDQLLTNNKITYDKLPSYWARCSSEFTLENWDDMSDYPDLLGETYNNYSNYLINVLCDFDLESFKNNYPFFFRFTLLYQEYVRKDTIPMMKTHSIAPILNVIAKPFIEFSTISGAAYLWGELVEKDWKNIVVDTLETEVERLGNNAESILINWAESCNYEVIKPPAIYNRDSLLTGWESKIKRALQEKNILVYENKPPFGEKLKNDNKFVTAFLGHRPDFMFTTKLYEIHLKLCINKYLPDCKLFKSHYTWEKDLDIDEI